MNIAKINYYIVGIALVFGFLVVLQGRSVEDVSEDLVRDMHSNIFQEISILKSNNEDLRAEITELEATLEQLSDQNSALTAIEDQIGKYTKLRGVASIFGPGVTVTIDGKVNTAWIIDLVNELFNAGAEAVSVNGIRIVNQSAGFDTLPQGQILLNGSILSSPYTFQAIGESSSLKAILEAPGSILPRMNATFPDVRIEIVTKEVIQMD